ncbi:endopeptidase La [Arenicella sp. 4NH20-0111]|uniref:endopeptidase La n=1 Tax=Arenicella sp. 4NH20-0111 TaxID=3127648 RepID=UPI0031042C47
MSEQPPVIDYQAPFPLLPLRDVVVFPHMVIPLFVGREKSILALEHAMDNGKLIALVAQLDAAKEEPSTEDVYEVGVLANILQMLKLPDGTVKVLVEGMQRIRLSEVTEDDCFRVIAEPMETVEADPAEEKVAIRTLVSEFESYAKINSKVAPEALGQLKSIDDLDRLVDTIGGFLDLKLDDKQHLLEAHDLNERLDHVLSFMESELDMHRVEKKIRGRVKKQMEKSQREYYLNEQMKAIQNELGESEDGQSELDEIQEKIEQSGMSKEAREKVDAEVKKLRMMSPMSAEAAVVRNYIDWIVQVPWKKRSRVRSDIHAAQEILDEDHYGLEKVKERILEYLAVQQRLKKMKGPILCLVGPPGVGKTSLGKSIAKATNRKFIRMSLGGVRDEAEIRGHRRTYIGSMPGKIVQNMSKIKTKNPLFLLDEIDKMAADFRGDPASAMLEVLDPEQNSTFADHYLEVDYDLSEVMFVATSNSLNIPGPLLDRMEVIRLEGYTEAEKLNIAQRYLVKKQKTNNGLRESEIEIAESAITDTIRYYTREAGVRGLEREMAKICRKVTKKLLLDGKLSKVIVNADNLSEFLGVRKFSFGLAEDENRVGQVTGLAWTSVGGELLTIESAVVPGKGKQTSTGKLGDVMQESIQAAITVIRSRAEGFGIKKSLFSERDFHIHVPEGATPKDGPSAGIGMCTALISAITDIPVRADVAMTGEITLRGEVLPIGGLKEKLLAAHRGGIKHVIIPHENEKDLVEISDEVKQDLTITPVKWIDEVLEIALVEVPVGKKNKSDEKTTVSSSKSKKAKESEARH